MRSGGRSDGAVLFGIHGTPGDQPDGLRRSARLRLQRIAAGRKRREADREVDSLPAQFGGWPDASPGRIVWSVSHADRGLSLLVAAQDSPIPTAEPK